MSFNDHLVLAPIRGVTNYVYRNALEQTFSGADSAIAPYIVTKESNELNERQIHDVLPEKNLIPTTAQILTKEIDQFLYVANIYKDFGVKKVNLNMGCPYPMVANRTKGSGLLLHPQKVEKLLTGIKEKCPIEFTVKIRLGREDVSEIKEIIPMINKLEINDFTIHARYGKQIYVGGVDLDAFEECLPLLNTPPCYNGDINTVEDFKTYKARFPQINRWMVGRAGLSNPALMAQIKGSKFNEQTYLAKFIEMHKLMTEEYLSMDNAKSDYLQKMRGHWLYFKDIFENEHKVYKKVKKAKSIEHYNDVVEWIFEQDLNPDFLD
ncbi:tRNA-dihydrouridine synthase [Halobacteriovorax sp. RT-2-6]|uniref:tRNA-dihydrouridine synthase n=1 Tax=unclassified Halobacteriovorax TaxID=2639665 RepID=UPI00399C0757